MADTVSRNRSPLRPAPDIVRAVCKEAANKALFCTGVYTTSKEVGRLY